MSTAEEIVPATTRRLVPHWYCIDRALVLFYAFVLSDLVFFRL